MATQQQHHYRVTRPQRYGPGTPGHTDPAGRQGYYTDAATPTEAAEQIRQRIHQRGGFGAGLPDVQWDVQLWEGQPLHGSSAPTAERVELDP